MATILHVDMDAFFASVEQRDHPEWRGKPVIVGAGPHERGVVSTCSYEARKFGVHSAMPSRTAYERCPQGIFVPPDMRRYHEASRQVFEIFSHYSPFVEAVSVDEAFLNISGTLHLHHHDPAELGEALRREVRERCRLTCSVGIAPNRLLAKIGSEQHKPDGLTLMPFEPRAIAGFLAPKPLSVLWGVGEKTAAALRPYGIVTCGDVQRLRERPEQLVTVLGEFAARELLDYAFGIDGDEVHWQETAEKSVSREYTFDEDENGRENVRQRLLQLITEVGRRFRREERWARTAKLKLRTADFKTVTRQRAFDAPARDDLTFRAAALALFDELWPRDAGHDPIRLIGFGVTNLQNSPAAPVSDLFAATDARTQKRAQRERLAQTLDDLHRRGLL